MRKIPTRILLRNSRLAYASQFAGAADPAHSDQPSVAPAEAISKLKEGNERYMSGNLQHPGQKRNDARN